MIRACIAELCVFWVCRLHSTISYQYFRHDWWPCWGWSECEKYVANMERAQYHAVNENITLHFQHGLKSWMFTRYRLTIKNTALCAARRHGCPTQTQLDRYASCSWVATPCLLRCHGQSGGGEVVGWFVVSQRRHFVSFDYFLHLN